MGTQADDDDIELEPGDLDDLGDLGEGDDDDEADEGNASAGASGAKAYKPPTEGEWDRLQRRLKKALGKPAADVDRKLAAQISGRKKAAATEDDEADEGNAEAERWRGIAIQQAAAAQIAAAGFTGTAKQATRLARLMDTGDIRPDRNGAFDLEDEIDDLKDEYPQLFAQTGDGRRRPPTVRRGDTRTGVKKDPTKATSDALMKQAGYR